MSIQQQCNAERTQLHLYPAAGGHICPWAWVWQRARHLDSLYRSSFRVQFWLTYSLHKCICCLTHVTHKKIHTHIKTSSYIFRELPKKIFWRIKDHQQKLLNNYKYHNIYYTYIHKKKKNISYEIYSSRHALNDNLYLNVCDFSQLNVLYLEYVDK